jgi:hypothetical protein
MIPLENSFTYYVPNVWVRVLAFVAPSPDRPPSREAKCDRCGSGLSRPTHWKPSDTEASSRLHCRAVWLEHMKVQKVVTYHSPQPKAAARIAQCLLLALSSDRDGEVVAVVAAPRRRIASADLTIHAVADAVQAGLGRTPAPLQEPDWRDTARFCRKPCWPSE